MCINPITIPTPSHYLSRSRFSERLMLTVGCGRCCECGALSALQWNHRITQEYNDCISKGGYVLFDTLTYDNDHLPKVSRFYPGLPKSLDFQCFDYEDVKLFLKRLRKRLFKQFGYKNLRYFIVSEYGQDDRYTHRPHYHALFFVDRSKSIIDPCALSSYISAAWSNGRTDGIPFKPRKYVLAHNVLDSVSNGQLACLYVSKYVQKNSSYQSVIDSRIDDLDAWFKRNNADLTPRKVRIRRLRSRIGQFHRQSLGFGLSAIKHIDVDDVVARGYLVYQPYGSLPLKVPLSTYFKRKLLQECIYIGTKPVWQLNDDGKRLADAQRLRNTIAVAKQIGEDVLNAKWCWTQDMINELADYVVNLRGRSKHGTLAAASLTDKDDLVYAYTSTKDKSHFGSRFVCSEYLGNDVDGYVQPPDGATMIPWRQYLVSNLYHSKRLERLYDEWQSCRKINGAIKQRYTDTLDELEQRYKLLGFK